MASSFLSALLIAAFMLGVTTTQAHAYIDPGSGSFMLQILLATVFASLFALKVFWRRLTGRASRFLSKMKRPREKIK